MARDTTRFSRSAVLLGLLLPHLLPAQSPGSLDTTFGNGGVVSGLVGVGATKTSFSTVLLDDDGHILIGSGHAKNGVKEFVLTRYTRTGTLDATFGGGDGIMPTPTPVAYENPALNRLVKLDGGGILALGQASRPIPANPFPTSDTDQFLLRYSPAGDADPAFGGGDGLVSHNLSPYDWLVDGLALPDGKILGLGWLSINNATKPTLFRYLADGQLDTSFSGDGHHWYSPTEHGADGIAMALQSDQKVVVAGYAVIAPGEFFSESDSFVLRCHPDGTLDTSFGGGDGVVLLQPDPSSVFVYSEGQDVVVLPDGRIVVGGYAVRDEGTDVWVARFNADGAPDATFGGGDGLVMLPGPAANSDEDRAHLAVLPDGGLIVGAGSAINTIGTYESELILWKLKPDGSLDPTFGAPNGWVAAKPAATAGESFLFDDMALQTDGKLVVVGERRGSEPESLGHVLARYHVAGGATQVPLAAWRQLHFGTTADSGPAANDADPNGNGAVNLVEFAMGTDPKVFHPGGVTVLGQTAAGLEVAYTRSKTAAAQVNVSIEWSDTLVSGTWSTTGVTERLTGTAADVESLVSTIPAGPGGGRWVRLRVRIR
jgi:uncharacterized delta-60 repeat protein